MPHFPGTDGLKYVLMMGVDADVESHICAGGLISCNAYDFTTYIDQQNAFSIHNI